MTIAEAFKIASKIEDDSIKEIFAGLDENNNPSFRNMLLVAIGMGGFSNPRAVIFTLASTFQAGKVYGEAKSRAEFTDPFKELGEMPQTIKYGEHEH